MGIPKFASRMHKYGVTKPINPNAVERSQGETFAVVIDGPALAYHLYRSIKKVEPTDVTIAIQCDYEELGRAAVQFLDLLASYGFTIEGIYFDGVLPSEKKQTRKERMNQAIQNLATFKTKHDRVFKSSQASKSKQGRQDLHEAKALRNDIPFSPLLVPAVFESLLASDYAHKTWLVTGEADPFCAAAALKCSASQVTIFTNDSDLLIYPTGAKTRIVMLKSLHERVDTEGKALVGLEFNPASLAEKTSDASYGLILPAYKIKRNSKLSFEKAIEDKSSDIFEVQQFQDFAKTFDTSVPSAELVRLQHLRRSDDSTFHLDPRVSELVKQCMDRSRSNGKPQTNEELEMYLPILVEDPTRASAWKVGATFRGAAESLLLHQFRPDAKILELRRSGNGLVPVKTSKMPMNKLSAMLMDLAQRLSQRRSSMVQWNLEESVKFWRSHLWDYVVRDMQAEGKSLPESYGVDDIFNNQAIDDWQLLHLSALFQAEYFSLRMLKQVLTVINVQLEQLDSCWQAVNGLIQQLMDLPNIASMFAMSLA